MFFANIQQYRLYAGEANLRVSLGGAWCDFFWVQSQAGRTPSSTDDQCKSGVDISQCCGCDIHQLVDRRNPCLSMFLPWKSPSVSQSAGAFYWCRMACHEIRYVPIRCCQGFLVSLDILALISWIVSTRFSVFIVSWCFISVRWSLFQWRFHNKCIDPGEVGECAALCCTWTCEISEHQRMKWIGLCAAQVLRWWSVRSLENLRRQGGRMSLREEGEASTLSTPKDHDGSRWI